MSHQISHEELVRRVEEAKQKVVVGGVYYHWKNPNQHYKVIGIGLCEWEESVCVVYQQLNVDNPLTWVRRLEGVDGWLESVEDNGSSHPRFYPVES